MVYCGGHKPIINMLQQSSGVVDPWVVIYHASITFRPNKVDLRKYLLSLPRRAFKRPVFLCKKQHKSADYLEAAAVTLRNASPDIKISGELT